jgi:hypothetical protein
MTFIQLLCDTFCNQTAKQLFFSFFWWDEMVALQLIQAYNFVSYCVTIGQLFSRIFAVV